MKPLIACALILIVALRSDAQTAPRILPFQGRLTDQNGVAVSNGVRLVQFKIYTVPAGGSPVWAGELHRTTVNGGLVNVLLGSKTPLSGVDFNQQLYLEITVDVSGPSGGPDNAITAADPPMLPRQVILPVIFAKESANTRLLGGYDWSALFGTSNPAEGKLDGARIATNSITAAQIAPTTITANQIANGIITSNQIAMGSISSANLSLAAIAQLSSPVGSITAFMGMSAPAGWLLCDGAIVSTNQYPALFNVIGTLNGAGTNGLTFRLPDLRGMFLRGADTLPDLTFTPSAVVTNSANTITIPNHGITRTGYLVSVTNTSGTLPGGLVATNFAVGPPSSTSLAVYYAIVVNSDTIKLAVSEVNAFNNIPVVITTRGTGTNRLSSAVDPDRNARTSVTGGTVGNAIGSFQVDMFKNHAHSNLYDVNSGGWQNGGNLGFQRRLSGAAGGSETRPKNIYVNYIIKY